MADEIQLRPDVILNEFLPMMERETKIHTLAGIPAAVMILRVEAAAKMVLDNFFYNADLLYIDMASFHAGNAVQRICYKSDNSVFSPLEDD
jgi:hypothetical protein